MNTIEELVICPFCNEKVLKHFATYRDHINDHDREVIKALCGVCDKYFDECNCDHTSCFICDETLYEDDALQCSNCDQIACIEHYDEFKNLCHYCLNSDYNKGIRC